MAGGISGNLKPAFSRFAKGELTAENLLRSLINENFWRGGNLDIGYKTRFRL